MKILLTNDDGIHSKGLHCLASHLLEKHEVTIIAPLAENSGISHSFTIFSPLFIREVSLPGGLTGHGVNGTPSDCVKIGVKKIMPARPDMVISGFNRGENTGISAFYSGTVAGAREGVFFRIRSLSLSLMAYSDAHYGYAISWLDGFLEKLASKKIDFDGSRTFLNVNFPACSPEQIEGTRLTRQGMTPFNDDYEERKSPSGQNYFWLFGDRPPEPDARADETAVEKGFVTVTPLSVDMTDYGFLEKYSNAPVFEK